MASERSEKQLCPECGREIAVMEPYDSTELSFANHHRFRGGVRCPMAMQPVPSDEGGDE